MAPHTALRRVVRRKTEDQYAIERGREAKSVGFMKMKIYISSACLPNTMRTLKTWRMSPDRA